MDKVERSAEIPWKNVYGVKRREYQGRNLNNGYQNEVWGKNDWKMI